MNEKSKYTELVENLEAVIEEYRTTKDAHYCLGQVWGLVDVAGRELTKD